VSGFEGSRIGKNDGSIEAFDLAKLVRCLGRAMTECGHDVRYAEALGEAVALHVSEWKRNRPPSSEYLFRCCCTVLEETGLQDVARALQHHRRVRAGARRAVRVANSDASRGGTSGWRKGRIVQTLRETYGVSDGVSRILAGELERRALGLGYGVLSKPLLRELIRSEVTAWGLGGETAAVPRFGERVDLPAGRKTPAES